MRKLVGIDDLSPRGWWKLKMEWEWSEIEVERMKGVDGMGAENTKE